jgi:hypothetical protein
MEIVMTTDSVINLKKYPEVADAIRKEIKEREFLLVDGSDIPNLPENVEEDGIGDGPFAGDVYDFETETFHGVVATSQCDPFAEGMSSYDILFHEAGGEGLKYSLLRHLWMDYVDLGKSLPDAVVLKNCDSEIEFLGMTECQTEYGMEGLRLYILMKNICWIDVV